MKVQSEIDLGLNSEQAPRRTRICAPLCTLWLMILTLTTEHTEEHRGGRRAFQL